MLKTAMNTTYRNSAIDEIFTYVIGYQEKYRDLYMIIDYFITVKIFNRIKI